MCDPYIIKKIMFTGIIQNIGKIESIQKINRQARIQIQAAFDKYVFGESIAVNGTCLTVEDFFNDKFTVYASTETMTLTNLQHLRINSLVNLERALKVGDSLSGHFVSGHIDTLAIIQSISSKGDSYLVSFKFPPQFNKLIIKKGSIALDGISLTINEHRDNYATVNIIPMTFKNTIADQWRTGSQVNVEFDLLGKYICQNAA